MPKKINYASLYTLRKDGRYQGYWRDAGGARHALCDKDPAKLYERLQAKETPKAVTFGDVARMWEAEHVSTLSRGTQSTYKAPLESAIEEYGDRALADIIPADINSVMLSEKETAYSYKHAALTLSIYRQIYNFAIVKGYVQFNPCTGITVPRGMAKGKRTEPGADFNKLIRAHLGDPFGDFVAVLLYTGARTQEAAALRWGDIDTKAGVINIQRAVDLPGTPVIKDTKTEAGDRAVPLLDGLQPYIKRPKNAKKSDYIFSDGGELLTRSQITKHWITWCRGAGLAVERQVEGRHRGTRECTRTEWQPLITPHQLRHSYATELFEAGIDELTAMSYMGHADISITHKIYTELRQSHTAAEAKKLNAYYNKLDGRTDGKKSKSIGNR